MAFIISILKAMCPHRFVLVSSRTDGEMILRKNLYKCAICGTRMQKSIWHPQ